MNKHGQRSLAFQTLYGHATSKAETEKQLADLFAHAASCQDEPALPKGLGWELTLGTWKQERALDAIIGKLSLRRSLEEIGRMELVLLRLGLYEIIHYFTPPKVVMSECMLLAEEYGLGPGGKFVNGILDAATRNLSVIREEAQS